MKRIFVSLAIVSALLLALTFVLGYRIGDAASRDAAVQASVSQHFLTSLGALVFAALVHALVLTYFMGTGRWMEETTRAYRLSEDLWQESRALKSRTVPAMVACLFLLILTGAFGAAADPASPVDFGGWGGISGGTLHMLLAAVTLAVNVVVNFWEYLGIERNSEIIDGVMAEVRRIRLERGLPVE